MALHWENLLFIKSYLTIMYEIFDIFKLNLDFHVKLHNYTNWGEKLWGIEMSYVICFTFSAPSKCMDIEISKEKLFFPGSKGT